ncbi:hypothetical protein HELRODRAFT_162627 [Helobdella robusta]|uniref:Uncharacterized protein n=1 Tax=Helobdella robusta TaxID=6412 RepID=T1ESX8_HELRO|nr:hypothetical protein HELRODRAFT_162627 [Helobdella robusta]ESN99132.1 hypothetical protein HELRODRAFT_162627 [Helobdella robusta]
MYLMLHFFDNTTTANHLKANTYYNYTISSFGAFEDVENVSVSVTATTTNNSSGIYTVQTSNVPSYSKLFVLFKSILAIFFGIISSFGNSMTLVALYRNASTMRRTTATLTASLTLSAILTSFALFFLAYWGLRLYYFETPPCLMKIDLLIAIPLQQCVCVLVYFQVILLCVERVKNAPFFKFWTKILQTLTMLLSINAQKQSASGYNVVDE